MQRGGERQRVAEKERHRERETKTEIGREKKT